MPLIFLCRHALLPENLSLRFAARLLRRALRRGNRQALQIGLRTEHVWFGAWISDNDLVLRRCIHVLLQCSLECILVQKHYD